MDNSVVLLIILIMQARMVILKEDTFGSFGDTPVKRFTWETPGNFQVSVISYGATITSIMVPDKNGDLSDVVLGFDDLDGYRREDNPYFGATVGRCANRIAKGKFFIEDKEYLVAQNIGNNHLHGGFVGFDKKNWESHIEGNKVIFSYLSKDKEENYPGDLITNVTYEVTDDNCILLTYNSRTTKPTVVNLTNHSYFNLAGHETGSFGLLQHVVRIHADRYTEVDSESIPTGNLPSVKNTFFDLRQPVQLGKVMINNQGFDHNFCLNKEHPGTLCLAAEAYHPQSGRNLEVYTDQPGVQFYTSNGMPSPQEEAIAGKSSVGYRMHGAFCFETQNYPDAINHSNFPNAVLNPGCEYVHLVRYRFTVLRNSPSVQRV